MQAIATPALSILQAFAESVKKIFSKKKLYISTRFFYLTNLAIGCIL